MKRDSNTIYNDQNFPIARHNKTSAQTSKWKQQYQQMSWQRIIKFGTYTSGLKINNSIFLMEQKSNICILGVWSSCKHTPFFRSDVFQGDFLSRDIKNMMIVLPSTLRYNYWNITAHRSIGGNLRIQVYWEGDHWFEIIPCIHRDHNRDSWESMLPCELLRCRV